MKWSWFDLHWPWIGLVLSAALLLVLFTTNLFRSDLSKSRWFDPAWLAPAAYMIHQFEEYGIDARGIRFAVVSGRGI